VFPLATITPGGMTGVDKVKIGFSISGGTGTWKDFLQSLKGSSLGNYAQSLTVYHKKTKASIHFFVFSDARGSTVYIEFNPSRFIDPMGTALAHPELVSGVVEEIVREYFGSGIVIPVFANSTNGQYSMQHWHPDWKNMIRLSRLDVSRDMEISDPDFDPILIKDIQSKFSRGTNIAFNHGKPNGWANFLKGSDGRMKIYNKYEHAKKIGLPTLPKVGLYRFEYRLENRHLAKNHLHTLGDLSEDRFEAALRFGWEKSRLGTSFFKPDSWVELVERSNLSPSEKAEAIGYLLEENRGNDLGYSPADDRTLRNKLRSLGISFKMKLSDQGLTKFQLDLDLGDLLIVPP